MQEIFESEPASNYIDTVLEKWNELGPLNMKEILKEYEIQFNQQNQVVEISQVEGKNADYYGQVNENQEAHGFGRFIYNNGKIEEGYFKNNVLNGYGRVIYTAGQYYEGEFKDDNKHGFGRKVYTNGEIK